MADTGQPLELELQSQPERVSYIQDKRSGGLLQPEMEKLTCETVASKIRQALIVA